MRLCKRALWPGLQYCDLVASLILQMGRREIRHGDAEIGDAVKRRH
jgi:hypothetical protein